MKPGETDTERKAVYFTVYDSDGILASGNVGEGIVCAPSGSELQWKRATGTAYANSAGTFAHVGDGLYRYIPADAECAAAEGEAIAVLKIKKTGFSTQFIPVPILYSVDTASVTAIVAAVMAYTVETGVSFLQSIRAGLALSGKQADSSLEDGSGTMYAPDGTTARIAWTIASGIKAITRTLS